MCILILCTVSQPTVNWEVCVLTFTCYLFRRIPYKGAILNCDVIQLFELRPSILHHLTSTGQYSQSQVSADLAWFPAPRGRGKECCLCMRHQVPMITCILKSWPILFYLLKGHTAGLCSLCNVWKDLKSEIILLEGSRLQCFMWGNHWTWKITSLRVVVLSKCVDDSCNGRPWWFHHSLIIIHIEHGWWYASFTWEKSTDSRY